MSDAKTVKLYGYGSGYQAFATTMDVSCWSFIRMAHLAAPTHSLGTHAHAFVEPCRLG